MTPRCLSAFIGGLILLTMQMFGGSVQILPPLPKGAVATSLQVDAAGNIYIAGFVKPQSPKSDADISDAVVGKLSPDGSQVLYWTVLAGSSNDRALAIALGADNSVYVTGNTASTDFPATRGSLQPTQGASSNQAFAAKLDSKGAVVYATYIGGDALAKANGIAVDPVGHAFITGIADSTFPTSAGAVAGNASLTSTGFVVELDPTGSKTLVSILGYGGYQVAVDSQGNIYAAGTFTGAVPTTAGAFQTSSANLSCSLAFSCTYQHVAKIDATGTKLIYATYISGQWGSIPQGIALDSSGNLIVAGSANGADYPVTASAYQPIYVANPAPQLSFPGYSPPLSAGYITKLNASGTGILWSTYFAGSGNDVIVSMSIDRTGNIIVGGFAQSSDLPGLWETPVASRPVSPGAGFVARISADGSRISPTQLFPNEVNALAVRSDGTAIAIGVGGPSAIITFSAAGQISSIEDPADGAKVVRVAPGQLLTLYGSNLNGANVTFNGIPALVLYAANNQVNLQAPIQLSGQTEVTMQVVGPSLSESFILAVVDTQPGVFLSSSDFAGPLFGSGTCKGSTFSGLQALALNADGTLNSCNNPAPAGTAVTLFVNGLGPAGPALEVTSNPSAGISITTMPAPGAVFSLVEATVQPPPGPSPVMIPLKVGSVFAREQNVVIWTAQ